MSSDLTEEEMRRALFGSTEPEEFPAPPTPKPLTEEVITTPLPPPAAKKKTAKAFTPRLRVTIRVGNEYEGEMHKFIHDADTLSSLLAEQEAVKSARKKYKYVEVVSVKSM